MENPVLVTITSRPVGKWLVTPFSPKYGLQRNESGAYVRYEVPLYAISVEGGRDFKAIRFGLVNKNVLPVLALRVCDAGIAAAMTVQPTWVPTYSPHRFTVPGRPGAWRLIDGERFLIHQGAEDPTKLAGGSQGCVEIVGPGEWDAFLIQLETIGGVGVSALAASQAMTVAIEEAEYPVARLV